jgi:glycosyltransferase involved in cell wall biosynthesis
MKICLISNLYPPYVRGGAEKIAAEIAQGLKKDGHDIFVISTKPFGGFKSFKVQGKESGDIKIYRFYPLNIFYYLNDYKHNLLWRMKWHFWDIFNLHSYFVIKSILKKEKPDVVMTHNLKGIGYLTPYLIRKMGIEHIHTLHDVQLSAPSGLIISGKENSLEQRIFLRKWYEAICRWLFRSPDIVISPSKWLLDFYVEKGFFKKSKKIVLPNPVSSVISTPHLQERNFTPCHNSLCEIPRQARDDDSGELKLLYLGQIEEHKGILFLVNTLKNLGINFELHVAGVGSKLEEAKSIVQGDSRFIFHGFLDREEVEHIFSSVDFTIVPSLCYENSPAVIGESLAAGVPVLVAKIGGATELVVEGENGFTFEAGNREELKNILQDCVLNPEKIKKMKITAKESSEKLSSDFYIKNLQRMIRD